MPNESLFTPEDEPQGTEGLDDLEKQVLQSAKGETVRRPPTAAEPDTRPKSKLDGKSREELEEMYLNLESAYGRQGNEYGQLKKMADEILSIKASSVKPSEETPTELPRVTAADLLDNADAALENWYKARAAQERKAYDERIQRLESAIANQHLVSQHSDINQIANSPEFVKWVSESPLRVRVAQEAARGDVAAANDLLTDYKLSRKATRSTPEPTVNTKSASLEGNTSGEAPASSERRFKRSELIRLHQQRPDVYNDPAFIAEVQRAYIEGRVD